METLHTKIHDQIGDKTQELLKKKLQCLGTIEIRLGIDIREFYHKERLIFLICQHIAHLIDLHVQESKKQFKGNLLIILGKDCNINEVLKRQLMISR